VATLSLTLSQFYTILDWYKSQFVYHHFGVFLAALGRREERRTG